MVKIGNDWDELLKDEWEKPYYKALRSFLLDEYRNKTVYPPANQIFNSLKLTSYDDVRVVILGQDPYHEPRQAEGLAFSVAPGVPLPPSLVNIFKELEDDLGVKSGDCGSLMPWAKRGVLLLNTVLTVRAHQAASHKDRGWEQLTDRIIELLAERERPMVFVLWGAKAIAKKPLIENAAQRINPKPLTEQTAKAAASNLPILKTENSLSSGESEAAAGGHAARRHLIITAPHPSPLSAYRGFFGGRYFSRCNYFLQDNGMEPIDWSL